MRNATTSSAKNATPRAVRAPWALAIAVAGGCAAAAPGPRGDAALPPISPNRPTFSDGTSLVPVGHVQVETGWTSTWKSDAGVDTARHAVPEVLLRARLADTFEARVLWGGLVWSEVDAPSGGDHDHGGADAALAIVVPLLPQGDLVPAIAIEALTTLGVGSASFGSGHADPTAKLLWSYGGGRLPEWLGVGGNLIASWPTEVGDRFTQTAASLYATFAAPSADTSWFAEWYVVSEPANGVDSTQSVDFGAVQRLTPRLAVDARVGVGLDARADDVFAGIGASFLF